MIYCNDHEVILPRNKDQDDPVQAFYRLHKEKIQKQKDLVVIRKHLSESRFLYDDSNRRLRPSIVDIPFKWDYRGDRGQETWTYGESRKKNKSDQYSYSPSHAFVADDLNLDPYEDVEKIFILTVIGDIASCGCYVYDPIKEAELKAGKMGGDELDVRFLIYKDPEVTPEDLVLVAQAWGISDAEETNLMVVRNKLYDIVTESEKRIESTGKGYRQLISDIRNLKGEYRYRVENKAILNKAVQDEVVYFDSKLRQWFYKSGGEYICQVPVDKLDRKNEVLLEWLNRKPQEFEALKTEVWSVKETPVYSIKDIEDMNTDKELRTAAKNMNVKLPIRIGTEKAKTLLINSLNL